jgi:hypothetical protein
MNKNISKTKFIVSFAKILLSYCMTRLVGLSVLFHHWFTMLIYHLGMNNMPVGGRSSETWFHPYRHHHHHHLR